MFKLKFAIMLAMAAAMAQSPRFEVVSIKACKESGDRPDGKKGNPDGGGRIRWDPGRLQAECQLLSNVIRDAYLAYADGQAWKAGAREDPSVAGFRVGPVSQRVLRLPIQGAPAWIESAMYTIDAKTESPAGEEMMRGPMMQKVLEERFQLRVRRESRDVPVYELTVAAGGPKLRKSDEASCVGFNPEIFDKLPARRVPGQEGPIPCGAVASRDGITAFPGTTMAGLCLNLSSLFDRDVVDRTGLAGFFDVRVNAERVIIPATEDSDPPGRPQFDRVSTFRAFQAAMQKVGLRLQPARGTESVLVIEHVERPSGN